MGAAIPYVIEGEWLTINGSRVAIDVPGVHERLRGTMDTLYMQKGPGQIEAYRHLVERFGCPHGLVEVGVNRGGSVVFLHELLCHPRMACIEISPLALPQLKGYLAQNADIHVHHGTNQADRDRVLQIARELGSFEWVIDDASHKYAETRATFETLFPLLPPGGLYIIEDWSWSHDPSAASPDHFYATEPALTNLLFDLVIAHGTNSRAFAEFHSEVGFAWIRRGAASLPTDGSMRLDDYRALRDRPLSLI